jgi:hypothetical protein
MGAFGINNKREGYTHAISYPLQSIFIIYSLIEPTVSGSFLLIGLNRSKNLRPTALPVFYSEIGSIPPNRASFTLHYLDLPRCKLFC